MDEDLLKLLEQVDAFIVALHKLEKKHGLYMTHVTHSVLMDKKQNVIAVLRGRHQTNGYEIEEEYRFRKENG